MQLFVNANYNFVKWRFYWIAFSILWVLIGLGFYLKNGINWGIDFAGGANVVLKFRDKVPLDRLRADLADASIQQYGKPADRAVLIRLPMQKSEGDYAGLTVAKINRDLNPEAATGKIDLNFHGRDPLTDLLYTADPDRKGSNDAAKQYYSTIAESIISKRSELGIFTSMNEPVATPGVTPGIAGVLRDKAFVGAFNVLNQETVGPQVGKELQGKAIWAVILSTLAMGVYLWLRFDVLFGAAAVVCIIHDVTVSIAFLHDAGRAAQPRHESDAVTNNPDLGVGRHRPHRPAALRWQGHPRVRLDPPDRRPGRNILDRHDRAVRGHRLEQFHRPEARHQRSVAVGPCARRRPA
jgi:preprotein translocase subunit SecF